MKIATASAPTMPISRHGICFLVCRGDERLRPVEIRTRSECWRCCKRSSGSPVSRALACSAVARAWANSTSRIAIFDFSRSMSSRNLRTSTLSRKAGTSACGVCCVCGSASCSAAGFARLAANSSRQFASTAASLPASSAFHWSRACSMATSAWRRNCSLSASAARRACRNSPSRSANAAFASDSSSRAWLSWRASSDALASSNDRACASSLADCSLHCERAAASRSASSSLQLLRASASATSTSRRAPSPACSRFCRSCANSASRLASVALTTASSSRNPSIWPALLALPSSLPRFRNRLGRFLAPFGFCGCEPRRLTGLPDALCRFERNLQFLFGPRAFIRQRLCQLLLPGRLRLRQPRVRLRLPFVLRFGTLQHRFVARAVARFCERSFGLRLPLGLGGGQSVRFALLPRSLQLGEFGFEFPSQAFVHVVLRSDRRQLPLIARFGETSRFAFFPGGLRFGEVCFELAASAFVSFALRCEKPEFVFGGKSSSFARLGIVFGLSELGFEFLAPDLPLLFQLTSVFKFRLGEPAFFFGLPCSATLFEMGGLAAGELRQALLRLRFPRAPGVHEFGLSHLLGARFPVALETLPDVGEHGFLRCAGRLRLGQFDPQALGCGTLRPGVLWCATAIDGSDPWTVVRRDRIFQHRDGRAVAAVEAYDTNRDLLFAAKISRGQELQTLEIIEHERPGAVAIVLSARQAGAMRQPFDAKRNSALPAIRRDERREIERDRLNRRLGIGQSTTSRARLNRHRSGRSLGKSRPAQCHV